MNIVQVSMSSVKGLILHHYEGCMISVTTASGADHECQSEMSSAFS